MFVNCWHLSDHESHAMWGLYCGRSDGVVIKTTYERLRQSVNGLPIGLVRYEDFNIYNSETYRPITGAWIKRPMFKYENEVRIGFHSGWIPGFREDPGRITVGCPIDWAVEQAVELAAVFPGADYSYIEAVTALVEKFAPSLTKPFVCYSQMSHSPPY